MKSFCDDSLYANKEENAQFSLISLAFINADYYEPKKSLNMLPSNIDGIGDIRYMFQAQGYLIWSKSKMQKEALEFLMYICENNNTFGISRDLFDKQISEYRQGVINRVSTHNPDELDEYTIKAERCGRDVLKIYENLNYTAAYNYELVKLLHGELEKYLKNELTKEEFAKKIENFLWLLENEDK